MSASHLPAVSPNVCQVVVYRVADAIPDVLVSRAERWRWELWLGDTFLCASAAPIRPTDPVLSTEAEAHRSARVAAEALGYTP